MEYRQITEDYAVSGQIAAEDVGAIKAAGFRSVICNRPDEEQPGQPSHAVIEAAVDKKVYAISNMSDQSSLAPDTVITGPVWDMYPTVEQAVKLVKAGVFTAQDYGDFSRRDKGGSSLAPYHKFDTILPADVKEMVEKKKAEILDGNFRVDVDENTPTSD